MLSPPSPLSNNTMKAQNKDALVVVDPDRAQRIASAGQHLVMDVHSLSARADHLASLIAAIADHRFMGSQWVGGRHVLRASSERSVA